MEDVQAYKIILDDHSYKIIQKDVQAYQIILDDVQAVAAQPHERGHQGAANHYRGQQLVPHTGPRIHKGKPHTITSSFYVVPTKNVECYLKRIIMSICKTLINCKLHKNEKLDPDPH